MSEQTPVGQSGDSRKPFWYRVLDRWLCAIGCHRWSHPGGECESCGAHDNLFD